MQKMDHSLEIVRFALALHLDIVPDSIAASDRLSEDLGLDPLDLVLVVLRLEEIAEAEFPVADLEHATTVDDLVVIVRSWAASSPPRISHPYPAPSVVASPW